MKPLRVVIVDDEALTRERVRTLVAASDRLQLVGEGANGLEALDLIAEHEPDLVFIDVEMPELSGFGVIAAIDDGRVPGVVFITAYEQYALKAFDVGAIDYLHKPITKARFEAAVERAYTRLQGGSSKERTELVAAAAAADRVRGARTRFVVRRGTTHFFVSVDQVDWIDAADNYLQLHVGDRAHLVRGTLKVAEEELGARFVRIHRSAIVALDRVTSIKRKSSGRYVVELRSGARLRTSRAYAATVRQLLDRD